MVNLISTPTLSLLLRFTLFASIIDEFAFYEYHANADYDTGFKVWVNFCWKLTN